MPENQPAVRPPRPNIAACVIAAAGIAVVFVLVTGIAHLSLALQRHTRVVVENAIDRVAERVAAAHCVPPERR